MCQARVDLETKGESEPFDRTCMACIWPCAPPDSIPLFFLFFDSFNGLRYPLVGGTRERHFAGINFKPRKELENAQTPTSRVHAVLGGFFERKASKLKQDI